MNKAVKIASINSPIPNRNTPSMIRNGRVIRKNSHPQHPLQSFDLLNGEHTNKEARREFHAKKSRLVKRVD